jgi:hypothetical protein
VQVGFSYLYKFNVFFRHYLSPAGRFYNDRLFLLSAYAVCITHSA